VCDLAYVVLLEERERQTLADRQALIARGVVEDLPSFRAEQQRIDEALAAEPKPADAGKQISPEQMELRRALGVA
jgi:hypothetical protein